MTPGFIISLPGKILSAIAIVSIAYLAGQWQGRSAATEKAEARAAQATIEQLKERGLINESVSHLSDCDLIRELGGGCE